MKGDRSTFDFISNVTAYADQQDEDFAPAAIPVAAGTPVMAAAGENETRKLNGESVPVVRFTIGTGGWCWVPRQVFAHSAVKTDRPQT
jgi:hypothetical protein